MNPERWQQVKEIFHSALKCEPSGRAAHLAHACGGDESLRQEVESLLANHQQSQGFVENGAIAIVAEMPVPGPLKLEPRRQIAHYSVLSLLGAGGMGEVYLAEDTRLGRPVALKILPEKFTADTQRVRRFEHEARAASALNHPNIVTVYEIGETDALQYIATEYIDGKTLRQRMAGIRSLYEILDVAGQVASALAAAHQVGILHRDIKPENIMLRRDGFVKVLDFGLAKLSTSPASVVKSDIPTKPMIKTDPGMVMGTVQYMSPEQSRGADVDPRTDIWSLGVVLYEMLCGHPPFEGETPSHVIVSILENEPGPLAQFLEAPAELQRILYKVLRKNRDERYQTARDLALDLNNLKRELDIEARLKQVGQVKTVSEEAAKSSTPAGDVGEESTVRTASVAGTPTTSRVEYVVTEIRKHKLGVALAGSTFVLLLVGISYGLYGLLYRPKAAAVPFQRTKVTRLTTSGKVKDAAISPDGKYVAYVEAVGPQQSLWIRQVATGTNLPVIPAADVYYWGLTFSPDSNYIYFVSSEKADLWKLYRVIALGGTAKKLLDHIDSAITFSPDGKRFAFLRAYLDKAETKLMVANSDGSNEQTLTTRKAPDFFVATGVIRMAWSPDGKIIACPGGTKDEKRAYEEVVGVRLEDGSQRSLSDKRWGRVYQVTGNGGGLVILGAEKDESSQPLPPQLWHMSYTGGQAQRITNDLNTYQNVSLAVDSQTLVTTQQQLVSNIWLSSKGDTSRAKQLTSGISEGLTGLTWTPDGKIVYRSKAGGKADVWMMDADGKNQRQLTHEGYNSNPQVSHDRLYIFFTSNRAGKLSIWRMDVNGNNEKQLTNGVQDVSLYVSPDGRWLFYISWGSYNGTLWKVPIDGGQPVSVSSLSISGSIPAISPDGKQIAISYYDEKLNPAAGVMILPIEGGPPTKRLKILYDYEGFARRIRWIADGSAVLYIDDRRANIWSQPINGGAPTQLTDFQGDELFDFAYSPDGNWLAVARGKVTEDVLMITDVN